MDIQISGKNMDLGEALQNHVNSNLSGGIHKYFDRGAEAHVTFQRERNEVGCEITAHLASGVFLAAHGAGGDAYSAFAEALEKIEKRVRRYKRRLKNHHAETKAPLPAENANLYLLASPDEEKNGQSEDIIEEQAPVIIAESQTSLHAMSVSDAVMQLDLSDNPAFIFKNAAHGRLNVVYRRHDGHIGWIDPS